MLLTVNCLRELEMRWFYSASLTVCSVFVGYRYALEVTYPCPPTVIWMANHFTAVLSTEVSDNCKYPVALCICVFVFWVRACAYEFVCTINHIKLLQKYSIV
jgi:hypothetical protein